MWFAEQQRLVVLAIMVMPSGGPKLLLWSNKQEGIGLFPAAEFDVIDPTLPRQWLIKACPNGHIELSPPAWQTDDFWERYHEDDPEALQTFQKYRQAITAEVPTDLP